MKDVCYKTNTGKRYAMPQSLGHIVTNSLGYDTAVSPSWGPYDLEINEHWSGFFGALTHANVEGAALFLGVLTVHRTLKWGTRDLLYKIPKVPCSGDAAKRPVRDPSVEHDISLDL